MAHAVRPSDSDDDIPAASGLNYGRNANSSTIIRPASSTMSPTSARAEGEAARTTLALNSSHNTKRSHTAAGISEPSYPSGSITKKPKKKAKPMKAYCLIWVCTHGKGQRRKWRQRDLKIVGVYPSKSDAEEAKENVMGQYDCFGHGDIMIGGTWEDEIDLVIREAPMKFS